MLKLWIGWGFAILAAGGTSDGYASICPAGSGMNSKLFPSPVRCTAVNPAATTEAGKCEFRFGDRTISFRKFGGFLSLSFSRAGLLLFAWSAADTSAEVTIRREDGNF